ncbi:MAG: YdcF family protein [Gammaproteobacteria bacterium]|nr:YdcF family protein [Gammaproteobacteria bacterium]
MEILITRSLETLLFPPASIIVLLVVGLLLLLLHRQRRWALAVMWFAIVSLYVLSLPSTAHVLTQSLEIYPALQAHDLKNNAAQAIVVLGAGRYPDAPEYGGDTVSTGGLERLRYAVHLHRLTGLPLVVSGGSPFGEPVPEAVLMKESLVNDFQITAVWLEDQSHTTAENAFLTKALLDKHGIHHIYLVTHAWHMSRAVRIFEQTGLAITPAPSMFSSVESGNAVLLKWLPNADALKKTCRALHEKLGLWWYQLRHRAANAPAR